MKKSLFIIALFAGLLSAQDIRNGAVLSLYSDYKATRIGDAITIIVIESSNATNQSEITTGRQSNLSLSGSGVAGGTTLPSVAANAGTNNDFNGKGTTRTSGTVTAKISGTIDSVLANGNLRISGTRKIVINGEEQRISVKGYVRVSDIAADNTVLSSSISEAEIYFDGEGAIKNNQKPGWLTRFFHWLF